MNAYVPFPRSPQQLPSVTSQLSCCGLTPCPQALGRIKKNTAYFRVNYLMVVLTTCVVTFVMHPSSLFVLGLLLASWIYLLFIRQTPVVISGRQLRCVM